MEISRDLLRRAVESIADADGVFMDPASLTEDVFLLAYAFSDPHEFMAAVASTCRALKQLVLGRVTASDLKYTFEGWQSYHYQHRAGQGVKATCRIMYRRVEGGIEVMGFGHRRIPADFYERMEAVRANRAGVTD